MPYHAPLFALLSADPGLDLTVIYESDAGLRPSDLGFGSPTIWDVEMLEGYRSLFVKRASMNPRPGSFMAFRDPDVVQMIAAGRFDVLWLHGYNYFTHQLAAVTQMFAGRGPIAFREEQTLLDRRPVWRRAAKAFGLRLWFRRSYGMHIGTENKRWFLSYGMHPDRLFFTPYAVDNAALRRQSDLMRGQRAALRAKYGLPGPEIPVIVMVARLIAKKSPATLLDAFARLGRRGEVALVFAGSGELEADLQARVSAADIADVHFLGFVSKSHIAEIYALADLFVLPSTHDETWGMVVNEAMNFGIPVVVSDRVGSATDLVREGVNGHIFPAGDAGALTAILARLLASPDTCKAMGEESVRIVGEWTYEKAALGVTECLLALTGARKGANRASR